MHKLGRHYRQPVVLIFSPPIVIVTFWPSMKPLS
jgi:hypothetical protein